MRPGDREVVVVGGGQAGLSMSYCLAQRGIDHVVLERDRIASEWRAARWDSFCLVTPNWQCRLPGFPYAGDDPDGFMVRDEIVDYVESYAAFFDPPVAEGMTVTDLTSAGAEGGFVLDTTKGETTAGQVVIATGGYHVPRIPRFAERLAPTVVQISSSQYLNADALPAGDVLVVGTGQSGCQIAEDLHLAGRTVHLCVGGATRTARFYRGRDVVAWLDDLGYYDMPVHEHKLGAGVRAKANQYVTGRDGGRDIDLRQFALEGMRLYGRVTGLRDGVLTFAPDLKRNLDNADASSEAIKDTIDQHIAEHGIDAPSEERYTPVWQPGVQPRELDVAAAGISSVIWCMGFASDFTWVNAPIFDGRGRPCHERGVTDVPGLYVLGLPWLYTWGSGRFSGIARDAEYLAEKIAAGDGTPSVAWLARPAGRAVKNV
ncbi:MAG: putative flavoprotein involved in transport [Solirubrobacteraceae bacterium]|jgi:putative flavoprotein involved in K+ transport|nr:putative flavoprotein involved in transport [Solirubrobacteraceae bacterium]